MSNQDVLDPRLGAASQPPPPPPPRQPHDGQGLPPHAHPPQQRHQQQQPQQQQQQQGQPQYSDFAQAGPQTAHGQPPPHGSQAYTENTLRAELQRHSQPTPPQPYYQYPYPPQAPPSQSNTPQQQPGPVSSAGQSTFGHPTPEDTARYSLQGTHDDGGDNSANEVQHPDHPDNEKRARACEACRGLKVRCDQDPARPDIPCKRCAKAGRQCIITQPSRKRQKKADSRVAELEKKLDALTAVLHQQNANVGQLYPGQMGVAGPAPPAMMQGGDPQHEAYMYPPQTGGMPQGASISEARISDARAGADSGQIAGQKRRRLDDNNASREQAVKAEGEQFDRHARQTFQQNFNDLHGTLHSNVDLKRYLNNTTPEEFVHRINGLMPPDRAEQVFDQYKNELCSTMPAVIFPPEYTAAQLFQEKPILYVSIMGTASSGMVDDEVVNALSSESVGAIADCVVRHGAKSLELIQALQVLSLWHRPPHTAEQSNFYQIIHMAAVMGYDIGLGKRFNSALARKGFNGQSNVPGTSTISTMAPLDSDAIDARRAWIVSYYLCASVAMVLRRPNMIRWTNYMQECIEVLGTSPEAAESDKLLVEHIKIQHICEDIAVQFLMDDNTANISITDPKVTYQLSVLEQKLQAWKSAIPQELRKPSLVFFEHVTDLYLHEIALHFNHNVEDFRLPFTEESLKGVNSTGEALTSRQVSSLESCVRSAHAILDTFLGFDPSSIRGMPVLLYFVRCIYAVVVLIKMHVAVLTPGSELGKIEFLKTDALKVEHYLKASYEFLKGALARGTPHPKMVRIWGVLMEWFSKHKNGITGKETSNTATTDEADRATQENQRQTGLQVLSHLAATSGQQQQQDQQQPQPGNLDQNHNQSTAQAQQPQEWAFNPPTASGPYPPPTHPSNCLQNPAQTSNPVDPSFDPALTAPQQSSTVNADASAWGTDFEQAMDLALGGMGLPQGLDDWFLGDGAGSFGFGGDALLGGTGSVGGMTGMGAGGEGGQWG
ncbi:hypothetical protein MBLNU230_g3528t1 [Neophaeotheca triangularis]